MKTWEYVYDYYLKKPGIFGRVLFRGWYPSSEECVGAALEAGAIAPGDLFETGYLKQVQRVKDE